MLKTFLSNKINGTKNALFFLSRAPTHHSFTLICDSWAEAQGLSLKNWVGFSIFEFRFVFIKVYVFVQQMHGLFDFKTS